MFGRWRIEIGLRPPFCRDGNEVFQYSVFQQGPPRPEERTFELRKLRDWRFLSWCRGVGVSGLATALRGLCLVFCDHAESWKQDNSTINARFRQFLQTSDLVSSIHRCVITHFLHFIQSKYSLSQLTVDPYRPSIYHEDMLTTKTALDEGSCFMGHQSHNNLVHSETCKVFSKQHQRTTILVAFIIDTMYKAPTTAIAIPSPIFQTHTNESCFIRFPINIYIT